MNGSVVNIGNKILLCCFISLAPTHLEIKCPINYVLGTMGANMVHIHQAMADRKDGSGVLSTPSDIYGNPRNRLCRQGELDPSENVEKLWASLSLSLSDWRYLCQHGKDILGGSWRMQIADLPLMVPFPP